MYKICFHFILLSSIFQTTFAQEIQILNSGRTASLRGLSVVNDQVIWVSGSAGTVGLSVDSGQTWKWMHVTGYEKSDFRDIEAFSDKEAIILGITEPAILLRTSDGGDQWIPVYKDTTRSAFWDAVDFAGEQGALVGDPQGGKVFLALSADRGRSWNKPTLPRILTPTSGEAFFAASGSNISYVSGNHLALVSGGKKSCLYLDGNRFELSLNQGGETTGANSIAVNPGNQNRAFVVGGDFSHDTLTMGNSLLIQFNPFSQESPKIPPRGYRSCVEYLDAQRLICCGTPGVDVSTDGGVTWQGISNTSFHVCRRARSGKAVFLAGAKGTIARLKWD
jgi:photosystem II stability/assembly factor-like uncharacterized protein